MWGSIIDFDRRDPPAIDPVFRAVPNWYWSSSSCLSYLPYAFGVYFTSGLVDRGNKVAGRFHVRAVRSGP